MKTLLCPLNSLALKHVSHITYFIGKHLPGTPVSQTMGYELGKERGRRLDPFTQRAKKSRAGNRHVNK